MGIQISYRPLCNVNILHGYYLHPSDLPGNTLSAAQQRTITDNLNQAGHYSILNDLSISPTSATRHVMAGYRIVFRSNPFGFSLWLQAEANDTANDTPYAPFVPFLEPIRLTFQLKVKQPAFWNFTNLPLDDINTGLYYFSNRANNSDGGTLYLSKAGAYASDGDRVDTLPKSFSLDVADLGLHEITFVLENDIHRSEIICRSENSNVPLETCHLDWSTSPSGLYRLTAFDDGVEIPALSFTDPFYLNTDGVSVNPLAVIDLFYLPAEDFNTYALLDPTDNRTLLEPTYTLWWQNRLTHWRYIFDNPQSVSPDPDSDVAFIDTAQTQLITQNVQPLISGYRPIRFWHDAAETGINEEILLPNPGVEAIYPEAGAVFSEAYLGKFNTSKV